jgi:hypothetical protein
MYTTWFHEHWCVCTGPGSDDSYDDRRQDYQKNEVAVDYNAGFTGKCLVVAPAFARPPPACKPRQEEIDITSERAVGAAEEVRERERDTHTHTHTHTHNERERERERQMM